MLFQFIVDLFPEWIRWALWASVIIISLAAIGKEKFLYVVLVLLLFIPAYQIYFFAENFGNDWRVQLITGASVYAFSIYVLWKILILSNRTVIYFVSILDFCVPLLGVAIGVHQLLLHLNPNFLATFLLFFVSFFFSIELVRRRYPDTKEYMERKGYSALHQKFGKLAIIASLFMFFLYGGLFTWSKASDEGVVDYAPPQLASLVPTYRSYGSYESPVLADVLATSNIRALPSRYSKIIGSVTKGSQVTVLGITEDNSWYRVRVGNVDGYIFNTLIKVWR